MLSMSNEPKFRIKGVNPAAPTIGGPHAKNRDSPTSLEIGKKNTVNPMIFSAFLWDELVPFN